MKNNKNNNNNNSDNNKYKEGDLIWNDENTSMFGQPMKNPDFKTMIDIAMESADKNDFDISPNICLLSYDFEIVKDVKALRELTKNKLMSIIYDLTNYFRSDKGGNKDYRFNFEETGSEYCILGYHTFIYYIYLENQENLKNDFTICRVEFNGDFEANSDENNSQFAFKELMENMTKQNDLKASLKPCIRTYVTKYPRKMDSIDKNAERAYYNYLNIPMPIKYTDVDLKNLIVNQLVYFLFDSYGEAINYLYDRTIENDRAKKDYTNIKEYLESKVMKDPNNEEDYYYIKVNGSKSGKEDDDFKSIKNFLVLLFNETEHEIKKFRERKISSEQDVLAYANHSRSLMDNSNGMDENGNDIKGYSKLYNMLKQRYFEIIKNRNSIEKYNSEYLINQDVYYSDTPIRVSYDVLNNENIVSSSLSDKIYFELFCNEIIDSLERRIMKGEYSFATRSVRAVGQYLEDYKYSDNNNNNKNKIIKRYENGALELERDDDFNLAQMRKNFKEFMERERAKKKVRKTGICLENGGINNNNGDNSNGNNNNDGNDSNDVNIQTEEERLNDRVENYNYAGNKRPTIVRIEYIDFDFDSFNKEMSNIDLERSNILNAITNDMKKEKKEKEEDINRRKEEIKRNGGNSSGLLN